MTLSIERSRPRRPVTWLTIVGIVLLPVVMGGLLVAALYNPIERLDAMSAAIVNDDSGVELDGQLVPLGRQLTAGLVEGSDTIPSNIDWTISNTEDAASGLADGTYSAVITIPENFSAAATSTAPGSTPERATIEVQTAPDGRIVDDAITAQITQTAASVFGSAVSEQYLTNVLLGFTTLHDQLGEAASGADQLADGSATAASGTEQLADGAGELSSGAAQLADGAAQAASGAAQLPAGASALADGLGTIAGGTRDAASGATQLADGVDAGAAALVAQGIVPAELTTGASGTAAGAALTATATQASAAQASALATTLADLAADCTADCTALQDAADQAAAAATTAAGAAQAASGTALGAGGVSAGLAQFATAAPTQLAAQFSTIATNVRTLAAGLGQLADGTAQSASGAAQLSSGASQLSSGVSQLATGSSALASGVDELDTGATALADGSRQLADGTASLADGLGTAVTQIPTYTDDEAAATASVVADPVSAEGVGTNLFGAAAVPLLTALVLWFGGLGSFVAFQAVSARALTSRRPSVLLALRAFAPGAALGALQGLLVAGVVQLAASYDLAEWSVFAALCALAGVAFAAVNQALVAVFGGAGRWIAAVVGALTVATGVVSTVPAVLASVASILPVSPAYAAMLGALTPAGGVTTGVVALLVWTALSLIATTLVVARRRTLSARAALA